MDLGCHCPPNIDLVEKQRCQTLTTCLEIIPYEPTLFETEGRKCFVRQSIFIKFEKIEQGSLLTGSPHL